MIRTESATGESTEPAKSFMRKFRLPGGVDVNGISAGYENGVLTVTVPRSFVWRGFFIEPADLPQRLELLARAENFGKSKSSFGDFFFFNFFFEMVF